MPTFPKHRKHDRLIDACFGFILALGAPAGWMFLRIISTQHAQLRSWIRIEISESSSLYVYITIGCMLAFTLFGYFLGRRSDDISDNSEAVRNTLDQVNLLAITDSLTGLYNARYLHDHLNLEFESAKRYGTPLTCLMLDIDDFKKVNDVYGHPCGDAILSKLATILRDCIRRVDILGRLGGEEFLIVMPHASSKTAAMIAERIRGAVEQHMFCADKAEFPITISVGVACYPALQISDKSTFLKAVDDALYQAKRAGKNRTVIFEEGQ